MRRFGFHGLDPRNHSAAAWAAAFRQYYRLNTRRGRQLRPYFPIIIRAQHLARHRTCRLFSNGDRQLRRARAKAVSDISEVPHRRANTLRKGLALWRRQVFDVLLEAHKPYITPLSR